MHTVGLISVLLLLSVKIKLTVWATLNSNGSPIKYCSLSKTEKWKLEILPHSFWWQWPVLVGWKKSPYLSVPGLSDILNGYKASFRYSEDCLNECLSWFVIDNGSLLVDALIFKSFEILFLYICAVLLCNSKELKS